MASSQPLRHYTEEVVDMLDVSDSQSDIEIAVRIICVYGFEELFYVLTRNKNVLPSLCQVKLDACSVTFRKKVRSIFVHRQFFDNFIINN